MIKKIFLIFVTVLSYSLNCLSSVPYAQSGHSKITNLSVDDGLTDSFVLCMEKDVHGAIWALCEEGVNRITSDGCTAFPVAPASNGLPLDKIRSLHYHRATDELWLIANYEELIAINCSTLDIVHHSWTYLKQELVYVADASDGGIWCAYIDGTIEHCTASGERTYYTPDEIDNMPKQLIRFMLDDGNNQLYVGYNNYGMLSLDINYHTAKHYLHMENDRNSLLGNNVRALAVDKFHNLWVGTNAGLAYYDFYRGKFIELSKKNGFPDETSGKSIMGLWAMKDGTLWCAAEPGGITVIDLNLFDTHNASLVSLHSMLPSNSYISSLYTRCVIEDDYGNIWLGHYGTGVDVIERYQSPFNLLYDSYETGTRNLNDPPLRFAYGITTDSKNNLWIGGNTTLYKYRDNILEERIDLSLYLDRSYGKIYKVYCDSQDRIWAGIEDYGTIYYDTHSRQIYKVPLFEELIDVRSFLEDSRGNIWIGTEKGLALFDGEKGILQPQIIHPGFNKVVRSLQEDASGRIWIGTFGSGILIYDPETKISTSFTAEDGLANNTVNHIFKDIDESFWIATRGGLSYVRNPDKPKEVHNYGKAEGLTNLNVCAVIQDQMGQIWISNSLGVFSLNQNKSRFSCYDFRNGLPNGGFIEGSSAMLSDGTLYFASSNGICYFQPWLFAGFQTVSNVRIRRIESDVDYRRFDFSVENFAQRNLVEYEYKMAGLDNRWHSTLGDTKVIFHKLPPGQNTFYVRAFFRNGDGQNATIDQATIVIDPPLWLAWWAISLYLLAAIAIMFSVVHYYHRRLKLKASLLSEEKKRQDEKMLNEERIRFYTNVTHELRTPLTLILGPLEDLEDDAQLSENHIHKIKTIHENAQRLLGLINQLLEFHKTESSRRLVVSKYDLRQVIQEVMLRFEELNDNKNLALRTSLPGEFNLMYIDYEAVSTILNNLLSNAVKYTSEGEISVSLETQTRDSRRFAIVRVSDTGYGISKEALPHIFERYYQAGGKHQAPGSGIGLAIVRSLVLLHHGLIFADSKPDCGTTVSVWLPMDDSYPEASHKEVSQEPEPYKTDECNNKPVLLLVEDNDDIRKYIYESLGSEYNVFQARNGAEGLETAFNNIPDIVISDIMMPEMDGIELCKALKSDVRTSHIPVVLLTAKDNLEDKQLGYDCGADSYITKPFSAKLLQSRLHNIISARRKFTERLLGRREIVNPDAVSAKPAELNPLDATFFKNLNSIIDQFLDSSELDISLLADSLNMSNSTLYRKVKALTGKSPNEYIRYCRLLRAKEMLLSGQYNVSDTAYATGFSTPNYFRDCFKDAFNCTPLEYQKMHFKWS